jgi:hypothetical protein
MLLSVSVAVMLDVEAVLQSDSSTSGASHAATPARAAFPQHA